jgi:hypothetical protein
MHDSGHELLVAMGRDPRQGPNFDLMRLDGKIEPVPDPYQNTEITVVRNLPDNAEARIGAFVLPIATLRAQAKDTHLVIDAPPGKAEEYVFDPEMSYSLPVVREMIVDEQDAEGTKGYAGFLTAQRMAVVGPVHIVFDASFRPQAAAKPVVCVSIPAPNFAPASGAERRHYAVSQEGNWRVNPKAGLGPRLEALWYRILCCMRESNVTYPVLCAIGCGAFKGRGNAEVHDLPTYYATALRSLLTRHDYGFSGVAIAVPIFTDSDRRNRDQFVKVFSDRAAAQVGVPVLVSGVHSMIDLADRLSRDHPDAVVGILNPSDACAVRGGYLGMFFDGGSGTFALEELLALQTTLLASHVGFNPAPWKMGDSTQRRFVERHL